MSKTTVKKSIEGFDAPQLRQLILDIYAKSKEAKELLDFYAVPDIAKKIEEYKKPLLKEVWRYIRHAHHPRLPRIRATIKKFSVLDPGDEALAELRVFVILEFCKMASDSVLNDSTNEAIGKFFVETLDLLYTRKLSDEYEPQIEKAIRSMEDFTYYRNPLKRLLTSALESWRKGLK